MRTGADLPVVHPKTAFIEMLREMTSKGLGFVAVLEGLTPIGIFTDGDLRRLIERGDDLRQLSASAAMQPNPCTILDGVLAVEAASVMEARRITGLLVVNAQNHLVGAIGINDLLRAKVI